MASVRGSSDHAAGERRREVLARLAHNARVAKRMRIEQRHQEDESDPQTRYMAECRRRRDAGLPIPAHAAAMLAGEDELSAEPYDCSPAGDRAAERRACSHGVVVVERSTEACTAPAGIPLIESMGAALERSARGLDRRITAVAQQRARAVRPRMWTPRRRGTCVRPRSRARRTRRSTRAGPSDSSGDGSSDSEPPGGRHDALLSIAAPRAER
jgi:hypothetical protein